MSESRSIATIIVAAFIGAAFATVACFVFYLYFLKPFDRVGATPTPTPTPISTPPPTPFDQIPNPEIKAEDVSSVSINTVYKGYFDAGNKCAKSYNEYFGNEDGIASPSSPCTITVSFGRDGKASRSVVISRWDKSAKEKRVVEKTDSTAEITPEQFNTLAKAIVTNEAFRAWREGTMITVSNCSITVTHTGGTKSVMSNVDEKAIEFLPMVNAIKRLEKELSWKTVQ